MAADQPLGAIGAVFERRGSGGKVLGIRGTGRFSPDLRPPSTRGSMPHWVSDRQHQNYTRPLVNTSTDFTHAARSPRAGTLSRTPPAQGANSGSHLFH